MFYVLWCSVKNRKSKLYIGTYISFVAICILRCVDRVSHFWKARPVVFGRQEKRGFNGRKIHNDLFFNNHICGFIIANFIYTVK